MKISVKWLRELINFNFSHEELADILTVVGLEVDECEDRQEWANGIVVGLIKDCRPHPNTQKLNICKVDIGTESLLNIICGAPNVEIGKYVPVATLGTYLPKMDLKIQPIELQGIKSEGMICSLSEIGLSKESSEIHIFEEDTIKIGQNVSSLLGLDDTILSIMPTANRPDAMSMVGIAREIASLTGNIVTFPRTVKNFIFEHNNDSLKIEIEDTKACPVYIGTIIQNVTVTSSPQWLQQKLRASGIDPINNIVDITNLILLEWGQPMHAFDLKKLKKNAEDKTQLTIGVRSSNNKEILETLDGSNKKLNRNNLIITSNNIPVALAGIMGGKETEIDKQTKDIFLETALFDQVTIRHSSKSQNLRTEASIRYERGVNQFELEVACQNAIKLIQELAGGVPISQNIVDNRSQINIPQITLRLERIHKLLGPVWKNNLKSFITSEEVHDILTNLGCNLSLANNIPNIWLVTIPSYRYRDLHREIDLIEEIARIYGYGNFCDELPYKTEPGKLSQEYYIQRKLREAFRSAGLHELVQYSLVKPEKADIVLANPLLTEYSALRNNLLDGLISTFAYNQSQGNKSLNGFEIGKIFYNIEGQHKELESLAGIMGGNFLTAGRWITSGKLVPMTWYEAKGILDSIFKKFKIVVEYKAYEQDKRLHPGRTASLWLNNQFLGIFGQLHPQLCQELDLINTVYGFELNFEVLLHTLNKEILLTPTFNSYSSYPPIELDLAFFVSLGISVAELIKEMKQVGGGLLKGIELFDDYRGESVPKGQRNLAFSLLYRSDERTLTDKDVKVTHDRIRIILVEKFNVTLRS